MSDSDDRRRFLQLGGTALVGAIAGCNGQLGLGADGTQTPGGRTGANGTTVSERTATSRTTSEATPRTTTETTTETTPESTPQTTTESTTQKTTGKANAAAVDVQEPDGVVSSAPTPKRSSSYSYATMGSAEAPVQVTMYGGWKCPYTQNFMAGYLETFVERYVQTGKVQLTFRAVAYEDGEPFHGPDEPRLARAALALWFGEPKSYWEFFDLWFHNQRQARGWATTSNILGMMKAAGVSKSGRRWVREAINTGKYQQYIDQTMQRKKELGFDTIPKVVVDGEPISPNTKRKKLEKKVEARIEAKSGGGSNSSNNSSGSLFGDFF